MAVCESMVPVILASVESALDAAGETRLAAHAAACPGCRRALDEQKAVKHLLATLPPVTVSPDFAARVRQRVAQSVGWWEFADWRVWTLRLAPVAALLALLAWVPSAGDATTSTSPATPLASVLDSWAAGGTASSDTPLPSLLDPSIDARTLLADTFESGRAPGGASQ